jgi:uncharacterized membrane protein YbhN (UPF0104 family)
MCDFLSDINLANSQTFLQRFVPLLSSGLHITDMLHLFVLIPQFLSTLLSLLFRFGSFYFIFPSSDSLSIMAVFISGMVCQLSRISF